MSTFQISLHSTLSPTCMFIFPHIPDNVLYTTSPRPIPVKQRYRNGWRYQSAPIWGAGNVFCAIYLENSQTHRHEYIVACLDWVFYPNGEIRKY